MLAVWPAATWTNEIGKKIRKKSMVDFINHEYDVLVFD